MGDPIRWTNERARLGDLAPWRRNPRQIRRGAAARLIDSVETFSQTDPILVGPNNEIYDGHQRMAVWGAKYGFDLEVEIRRSSRPLTEEERRKLVLYLHIGATGEFDWDLLSAWNPDDLQTWGFDGATLSALNEQTANLRNMLIAEHAEDGASESDAGGAGQTSGDLCICPKCGHEFALRA